MCRHPTRLVKSPWMERRETPLALTPGIVLVWVKPCLILPKAWSVLRSPRIICKVPNPSKENLSVTAVVHVWRREETRRVHFARPWTQASKPALTYSSLAAKRLAAAPHGVFFSTKHPRPAR